MKSLAWKALLRSWIRRCLCLGNLELVRDLTRSIRHANCARICRFDADKAGEGANNPGQAPLGHPIDGLSKFRPASGAEARECLAPGGEPLPASFQPAGPSHAYNEVANARVVVVPEGGSGSGPATWMVERRVTSR